MERSTPGRRGVQAIGSPGQHEAPVTTEAGKSLFVHPQPSIWVAEWLQNGVRAGRENRDFAANRWWAHVDSNHGPLPYQAG